MSEMRLPDCRPQRRDEGVTSASSHPELISGDFTMRPRLHASLAPADHITASTGFQNLATICIFVVGALLLHSIFSPQSESKAQLAGIGDRTLASSCVQWHQTASTVVAQLAESTRDADLRQVNDAIFRMRRARRNCEEGWFTLACQDYYSVARSLPGVLGNSEESLFACRRSTG
jgi:hypothetical protein